MRFTIYYKNELDKACFQHDMTHRYFKYLTRGTVSDKIVRDKAFNFAKNPKYNDEYERDLAQWSIKCLMKRLLVVVLKMKIFQTSN